MIQHHAQLAALPVHVGPSFTVHIRPHLGAWRVYVERHWPQGIDPAHHMAATYRDQNKAECYAMALAETHGDCAVVYH